MSKATKAGVFCRGTVLIVAASENSSPGQVWGQPRCFDDQGCGALANILRCLTHLNRCQNQIHLQIKKSNWQPLPDLGQVRRVASPAAATPSEPQLISFPNSKSWLYSDQTHSQTYHKPSLSSLSAFLIKCFPLCLSMSTAISTPCPTFNQGVNMGLFCEKKAWQHKHKQYQAWHWIQCWLHQTIQTITVLFFETHLPAIANSLFYSSIYQPWHSGHDANILVQCSTFSLHTFTTGSDIAGLLSIQREGEAGKEHLWRWMLQLMTAVTHLQSDLFDSVRFDCTLANSALPLEVSADTADCCLFAIL